MKQLFFTIALLCFPIIAFAQPTATRQNREPARQFVMRYAPKDVTATPTVIETRWNNKPVIICFYHQLYYLPPKVDPERQQYHRIAGRIFIKQDSNVYLNYQVDNYEQQAGAADPVIESVFFANGNDEPGKELFVIVSWTQHNAEVAGKDYGTYAYNGTLPDSAEKLDFIQDLSEQLDGGCDCTWADGRIRKAIFKTAAAIQKELVRMGYKE